MPPFTPPPSNFLFNENIGANAPLPRSDYYRAQHMLNQLWSQVGPEFFPNRPQPTFDPQIRPGAPEPMGIGTKVPSNWAGIAYAQNMLHYPTGLGVLNPAGAPRPGEQPLPGVYGLAPGVVANLAHPSATPVPLPGTLTRPNKLTGQRPVNFPPSYSRSLQPLDPNDVLPSRIPGYTHDPRIPHELFSRAASITDAAHVPIHEWAHEFQGPSAGFPGQRGIEGGAEAFARIVTPRAIDALQYPVDVSLMHPYPQFVDWVKKHWTGTDILRNQFKGSGM